MKWLTGRRAVGALLFLVLAVGGGNLWATWDLNQATKASDQRLVEAQVRQQRAGQAAQRKAGLLVERAICTDMGTMANIAPPAGPAAQNPSRAFEQHEHQAWAGLYAGLGCKRIP